MNEVTPKLAADFPPLGKNGGGVGRRVSPKVLKPDKSQTITISQEFTNNNTNRLYEEKKFERIPTKLTVDQVNTSLLKFLTDVVQIIEDFEISLSSLYTQTEEEKEITKILCDDRVKKFINEVKNFEEQHFNEALQAAQGLFSNLSKKPATDLQKTTLLSECDIKKASLEVQMSELKLKINEIQILANKIGTPLKKAEKTAEKTNGDLFLQRKNLHHALFNVLLELLYRITTLKESIKIHVLMIKYFSATYSTHVTNVYQGFLKDFNALRDDIKKMIPSYNETKLELEKIVSAPIDSAYDNKKDNNITFQECEGIWRSQKEKQQIAKIQQTELEKIWTRVNLKVQHLLNQLHDYKAISDNNGSIPWGYSFGYSRNNSIPSPFDEYEKEKLDMENKIKQELLEKAKREAEEKIKKEKREKQAKETNEKINQENM